MATLSVVIDRMDHPTVYMCRVQLGSILGLVLHRLGVDLLVPECCLSTLRVRDSPDNWEVSVIIVDMPHPGRPT